ncbi:Nramp family divalent metal transporter [Sinomonas terrae]|uniref:Nramp family divalent metal transporter n=1 Tax=Sinomonas terrae TaxID=2908838 RepID=A0ABS9TYB9_9MICC|nr:Nramp family divalent metal transporter [Sinomonas terrae]MCH6469373.1 Nramp family divalent metal transporter [Sinomonas terrae]
MAVEEAVQEGRLRRYLRLLGPGLVTGAADDDPSGVATYAQAGATFGNGMLWTAPVTLPMMISVQEISDRTALATGEPLGTLIRRKFSRRPRIVIGILVVALLVANTLNIAADLMAIGQGMELLGAGPDHLWAAVAGCAIAVTLMTGSFAVIAKVFKWLCLALLAYVAVLFVAKVDWGDVLAGLAGVQFRWSWDYLGLLVGVLGTTISPYLFFWQSAHRVEEMRAEDLGGNLPVALPERGDARARQKLRAARADVFAGMAFSVLVMFAIIAASAATLGKNGVQIATAADAAKALAPVAGPAAKALFSIGFIGTGFLAIPVLAGSGSVGLAGLLGTRWGFDRSPRNARVFYSLLGAGIIGGILLALALSDPIGLLVFVAVVNGIAAAPFLIVTMLVSGDRKIMGEYANGRVTTIIGWSTAAIMAVAGAIGVFTTLTGIGS